MRADQVLEGGCWLPAELAAGLAGVAEQQVDLGGAEVARVDFDVLLPVQTDEPKATSRNSRTEWVSPVAMT